MGATVTTAKHVAAIRTASNKILYVLREQTYEKNCYPHTPSWSCVQFGFISDVMEAIFKFGSACEDGMLQSRSGRITPEGYIAAWLKLLEAPTAQPDVEVEFRTGTAFYDQIQPCHVGDVINTLEKEGRADLAECVQKGQRFVLNLVRDSELIVTLYQRAALSSWRIIQDGSPPATETNEALGYSPTPMKCVCDVPPNFIRIDNEVLLMQNSDGSWSCEGWAHSLVASYVAQYGKSEQATPGSFKKSIKTFREAVKEAPFMRQGVVLRVYTNRSYEADHHKRFVETIQRDYPTEKTDDGFEVRLTSDMDTYSLERLPKYLGQWRVEPSAPAAADHRQIDLFAQAA